MGYTTDFEGGFTIAPALKPEHIRYLRAFAASRRMKRDPAKAAKLYDVARSQVDLPIGVEAGYFVGGLGFMGQDHDKSVTNHNEPPEGQPGLWCQWAPNDDGTQLAWNECEKFYNYVEWLIYLRDHFLKPWGYVLNGEVKWQGEDSSDKGRIVVKDNAVSTTACRTWRRIVAKVKSVRPELAKVCRAALRSREAALVIADVYTEAIGQKQDEEARANGWELSPPAITFAPLRGA